MTAARFAAIRAALRWFREAGNDTASSVARRFSRRRFVNVVGHYNGRRSTTMIIVGARRRAVESPREFFRATPFRAARAFIMKRLARRAQ